MSLKNPVSLLTSSTWLLVTALASFVSCVTVNVNFPESAVQKATDDYVKDLYRAKEKGKSGANPVNEPSAPTATEKKTSLELILATLTEPVAWADGDSFKVDSEKALGIRERLRSRLDEILTHKRGGLIGEGSDGKLVLKEAAQSKKLLLKKLEKLVADENGDREDLYSEIVRANGLQKDRKTNVQKSFSRSFQAESPSGTWVQSSDGKWTQKP